MKRHVWLAGWLTWLLLPAAASAWEIASFDTQVEVHPDATATVTETIVADFTGEQRHGLYRDVPIHYADRLGQHFKLRLRVRAVTDERGQAWPFKLESPGRYRRIRIGDPEATVTGLQTYRVVYDVQRGAVRFFADHDECYWNLTGNEWAVPIRRVRAEIRLPSGAADLYADAFVGSYGATARFEKIETRGGRVVMEPPQSFEPYEGLTTVVRWAKGTVHPPSIWQVVGWWLQDNWVYGIPLLIFLGMYWLWHARGRDPRPARSQVVEYGPPEGFTPAETGALMDQRVDLRDITSTVIDLAVRGYLKLQPVKSGLFGLSNDYQLTSMKEWEHDAALKPHERELLKGIFKVDREPGAMRDLSDLTNEFYQRLPAIRQQLYQSLTSGGYVDGHPEHVRAGYLGAGAVGGFLLFTALQATQSWHQLPQFPLWIAAGLSSAIVMLFSAVMPRRTVKGAAATDKIFGFLEFLRRTDQDRVRRINDPSLFERCLPYALAFGVADQWARAFEGLYAQAPSWYGGTWDTFSTRRLSRDLNSATASMGETFASKPRGSSSSWGGSGGGGGGFSGGGGGGGGGGAW